MARILYIEDDVNIAALFSAVLEARGHTVDIAVDGDAGLAAHEALPFDIVAVDHDLPETTGLDLARRLLGDDPDLPILMVTGRGNERLASEASILGVSSYVVKDGESTYLHIIPNIVDTFVERLNQRRHHAALEQKLIEQETGYRNLIENFDHGIFIHRNYQPLFVNNALLTIFGYESIDDLSAAGGIDRLYAPHERERLRGYMDDRLRAHDTTREGSPVRYVFEGVRKDGSSLWLQRNSQTVTWQGGLAILGSVFDITEQVTAREALIINDERFRKFIDHSPSEFTLKDLDGNFLMVNRKFRDGVNWGETDHLHKSIYDALPPDAVEAALAHERKVIATGTASQAERTVVLDGVERTFFITKFPVFDILGEINAIGSINSEISEQVSIERSLERSERRFRDFAESASDWLWEMDEQLRFTYFSRRNQEITGFDMSELIG